jgi:hypothetical protein
MRRTNMSIEHSTTIIYILAVGGSVVALLVALGVVHLVEWMGG